MKNEPNQTTVQKEEEQPISQEFQSPPPEMAPQLPDTEEKAQPQPMSDGLKQEPAKLEVKEKSGERGSEMKIDQGANFGIALDFSFDNLAQPKNEEVEEEEIPIDDEGVTPDIDEAFFQQLLDGNIDGLPIDGLPIAGQNEDLVMEDEGQEELKEEEKDETIATENKEIPAIIENAEPAKIQDLGLVQEEQDKEMKEDEPAVFQPEMPDIDPAILGVIQGNQEDQPMDDYKKVEDDIPEDFLMHLNSGINLQDFEEPPPKRQKRDRGPRKHLHLTDFYRLRKVKYTLEFESPLNKKQLTRGQYIYTFNLKEKEDIIKIIDECKAKDHKRVYLDLGIHTKMLEVSEICILGRKEGYMESEKRKKYFRQQEIPIPTESQTYGFMETALSDKSLLNCQNSQNNLFSTDLRDGLSSKSWYLTPRMQAQFFRKHLGSNGKVLESTCPFSKDLNTLEYLQKDLTYYSQQKQGRSPEVQPKVFGNFISKKPELHLSKFKIIKFKKGSSESTYDELEKELKISLNVGSKPGSQPEILTQFGIQCFDYSSQTTLTSLNNRSSTETYMVTGDTYESSHLWLPQIFGSQSHQPILWSMNYLIPDDCIVASSGTFLGKKKVTLPDGKVKQLYTFKSKLNMSIDKLDGRLTQSKIGFILGNFSYTSEISDQNGNQIGTAVFLNDSKKTIFEEGGFYSQKIEAIVKEIENTLEEAHPSRVDPGALTLFFVPNLFLRKQQKQSINFAGGIHIFDQDILLQRNVVEKRAKITRILATSLAFDYFGNQIWEGCLEDTWLLVGLREKIGDRLLKQHCGSTLYRYSIMKRCHKFSELVEHNAERFSLSSWFSPHFSESEYGDDVFYLKCQMVMHILEQTLGETHFAKIMSDLFKESCPILNLQLLKKVLWQRRIRIDSIIKNWIEATGCPLISCSAKFDKKKNGIELTVEQHSMAEKILLLKNYVNKADIDHSSICHDGSLLLNSIHQKEVKETVDYKVESQRDLKRWFEGKVKLQIYQTDSAEIKFQPQEITLSNYKTTEHVAAPLICKVKKAIHKKKDDNLLMDDLNQGNYDQEAEKVDLLGNKAALKAEQLLQSMNDTNKWQFGLPDYIFSQSIREDLQCLFEVKNFESPILWIKIDSEFEFIRRVKVYQAQKNWIFQLLQERDPISQIEACKELAQFSSSEDVYKVLKEVAKNEFFFFKVRKHAFKALEAIQVRAFNKLLSHEMTFLIHYFKQRNFDEDIGFYKANNFSNVLEYYINNYLIKSLSKSREQQIGVRSGVEKDLQEEFEKLKSSITGQNIPFSFTGESTLKLIRFGIENKDNMDEEGKLDELPGELKVDIDTRQFCSTTFHISKLLKSLLHENDNSQNPFDDCFYIGKLLAALGNMDNYPDMPLIAKEATKYLNLDHIGSFSPQYSISKGAIRCYFNIRKQIFKYWHLKKPYIAEQAHESMRQIEACIAESEGILDEFRAKLASILENQSWPLELRAFIFKKELKHKFMFSDDLLPASQVPQNFLNPLFRTLQQIKGFIQGSQFLFAANQLEILAQFLEKNFVRRLNFKECIVPNDRKCRVIAGELWLIMAESPITFLDRRIAYWAKRIYNCIFFGSQVPLPLQFEQKQRMIAQPNEIQTLTSPEWQAAKDQDPENPDVLFADAAQLGVDLDTGIAPVYQDIEATMAIANSYMREQQAYQNSVVSFGGLAPQTDELDPALNQIIQESYQF